MCSTSWCFNFLMVVLQVESSILIVGTTGFRTNQQQQGGLPSCSVWSFSTSENPQEEIVYFRVKCVNRTSCEKRGMVEVMIRKNPPKHTKSSWGHLFFEPSLQTRNVELLMATTLSHYAAKFPQGGCIMKKAWTCGIQGTLNEWHFVHLWSLVRRFLENKVNQIERKTNKSRSKASSGSLSTMFMCMNYIIIHLYMCILHTFQIIVFSRKDFYKESPCSGAKDFHSGINSWSNQKQEKHMMIRAFWSFVPGCRKLRPKWSHWKSFRPTSRIFWYFLVLNGCFLKIRLFPMTDSHGTGIFTYMNGWLF